MRARRLWFPHATLSVFLWILWLLLANQVSGGHLVLGGVLAWLIPFATQDFWPEALRLRKPWLAAKFTSIVICDIILSNVVVAVLILGPSKRLRPAFIIIPLDIKQDFTITLLANTISLTPGTVSADLSDDRTYLVVHSLHDLDTEASVARIKQRYEAPLKEIFE